MNPSVQGPTVRQCPQCGSRVLTGKTECPKCRETLPEIPVVHLHHGSSKPLLRRGLLYMLLAAVIHYFVGGYSGMNLPLPISPVVAAYLSPLLFLSGLGFFGYALFVQKT